MSEMSKNELLSNLMSKSDLQKVQILNKGKKNLEYTVSVSRNENSNDESIPIWLYSIEAYIDMWRL